MRPLWPRWTFWTEEGATSCAEAPSVAETPIPSQVPAPARESATATPPSCLRILAIRLASEGSIGADLPEEPVGRLAVEERERAVADPRGAPRQDDGLHLIGRDLQREVRERV